MHTKTVYQLDPSGFLIGPVQADESPMEPGVFPLPFGCVDAGPLPPVDGMRQRFAAGQFQYVEVPVQPEPEPPPAPTLDAVKAGLLHDIDAAADATRLAVAGDPLRAIEHQRAEAEATAFRNAGYSGDVPPAVKSWADATGWSARQATDSILEKATAWSVAIYAIRDARLKAKEAVRNGSDEGTVRRVVAAFTDDMEAQRAIANGLF